MSAYDYNDYSAREDLGGATVDGYGEPGYSEPAASLDGFGLEQGFEQPVTYDEPTYSFDDAQAMAQEMAAEMTAGRVAQLDAEVNARLAPFEQMVSERQAQQDEASGHAQALDILTGKGIAEEDQQALLDSVQNDVAQVAEQMGVTPAQVIENFAAAHGLTPDQAAHTMLWIAADGHLSAQRKANARNEHELLDLWFDSPKPVLASEPSRPYARGERPSEWDTYRKFFPSG